jgi:hypothetical protein
LEHSNLQLRKKKIKGKVVPVLLIKHHVIKTHERQRYAPGLTLMLDADKRSASSPTCFILIPTRRELARPYNWPECCRTEKLLPLPTEPPQVLRIISIHICI